MKFIIPYNIFEMNTENDDHTVGNNWYLNNDKKFGEETPVDLPLDYFNEPEEEGDVDEEDYYSTPAGKSGLYNGVAPQKGGGLKKAPKAIYSMSAEAIVNEARNIIWYRGFNMIRNTEISPGSQGYWNIPKLYWRDFANQIIQGFPTVSITQGREAIDEWFDFNEKVKKYKGI